jgi:hypothetical protein
MIRAAFLVATLIATPASAGDTDGDGDGIRGSADRCPDAVGPEPDGCPPTDTDGDGLLDRDDMCADRAGARSNRGCPDHDRDRDGVVDRVDRCADRAGRGRADGCPPPDTDGDGLVRPADRCPEIPEVWNGVRDEDGCPDGGKPRILIGQGVVRLASPPVMAGRRLGRTTREDLLVAAGFLRRAGLGRITVIAVADHGLSYGDSIERARRMGEAARRLLIEKRAAPAELVRVDARGPDGEPRLEIRF